MTEVASIFEFIISYGHFESILVVKRIYTFDKLEIRSQKNISAFVFFQASVKKVTHHSGEQKAERQRKKYQ